MSAACTNTESFGLVYITREEDLEIAPDFFQMFGATAPLLDDPAENLLAVSAFNDNGLKQLVDERESAKATVSFSLGLLFAT